MVLNKQIYRLLKLFILFVIGLLTVFIIIKAVKLQTAASKPVDAFLVLGGSITREIYVAELARKNPEIPILISQGSQDPCIWLIFQDKNASRKKVWLEKCALNTFGNFYFSLPILRQWGVQKLKLITSATHLPRAKWMAQIILGAHGIWVEPEIVPEAGIPGNEEFMFQTALDVTRSILWAVLSQIIEPKCGKVTRLMDINIESWPDSGFKCEYKPGFRLN